MDQEIFEQIGERVKEAESVLILAHHRPDGDTLGSALALKMWLDKLGKKVKVFCKDRPAAIFAFMPQISDFASKVKKGDFDLVLAVDLAGTEMTGYEHKQCPFFNCGAFVINIDHHASNDRFGDLNFIDASAASTTVIVYRLLKFLNAEFDAAMATVLLTGIYTDTGSFMHSNTNREAYEVAAELLKLGARPSAIVKVFHDLPLEVLKVWGKVLSNARMTKEGVVVSMVQEDSSLLNGVVDYLNMVPEAKFSLLLNKDRRGSIKASLRTRDDKVDLTALAGEFGGGGHPKASGFTISGASVLEVRDRILSFDLSKKS